MARAGFCAGDGTINYGICAVHGGFSTPTPDFMSLAFPAPALSDRRACLALVLVVRNVPIASSRPCRLPRQQVSNRAVMPRAPARSADTRASAAITRGVVAPAARIYRAMGSTFAANASAAALFVSMPLAWASERFVRFPNAQRAGWANDDGRASLMRASNACRADQAAR